MPIGSLQLSEFEYRFGYDGSRLLLELSTFEEEIVHPLKLILLPIFKLHYGLIFLSHLFLQFFILALGLELQYWWWKDSLFANRRDGHELC